MASTHRFTRTTQPAPRPNQFKIWLQAIRVFSFTASIVPILAGSALAIWVSSFNAVLFLAMLVASVACHAGCNLANDYHDHRRGLDTAASLGPSGVIQQGLLSPRRVRDGMLVAFGVATVVGIGIVIATGWPILILALVCLALAYLYTGGPVPLAYIALGEVTVFFAMGPAMVGGSYYVLTGEVSWGIVWLSLPIGLLVAAILHANNIRDMDNDQAAGKITIATWRGRRFANWEFAILVGGAYPTLLALIGWDWRLWPVAITLVTVPRAVQLIQTIFVESSPAGLNRAPRQTAGLHLQFGLLTTLGLLLATIIERIIR